MHTFFGFTFFVSFCWLVFSSRFREKCVCNNGNVKCHFCFLTCQLEVSGIGETTKTTCTGVEMFKKLLDQGQAGDNIGALLRGLKREDVQRGQVSKQNARG